MIEIEIEETVGIIIIEMIEETVIGTEDMIEIDMIVEIEIEETGIEE